MKLFSHPQTGRPHPEKHSWKNTLKSAILPSMRKRLLRARRKAKAQEKARQIMAEHKARQKTPAQLAKLALQEPENYPKPPQKALNMQGRGPRFKPTKNTPPKANPQKAHTTTANGEQGREGVDINGLGKDGGNGERNDGLNDERENAQGVLGQAHVIAQTVSRTRVQKSLAWVPLFISALRQMPIVTFACKAAGINNSTATTWRKQDPEFAALCAEAIEQGVDALEMAAWKRASVGWQESIYGRDAKGNPVKVGEKTLYSDRLAEVLLKGNRSAKYKDRVSQELSGPGGAPIQPAVASSNVQILIQLPPNGRDTPEITATTVPAVQDKPAGSDNVSAQPGTLDGGNAS